MDNLLLIVFLYLLFSFAFALFLLCNKDARHSFFDCLLKLAEALSKWN